MNDIVLIDRLPLRPADDEHGGRAWDVALPLFVTRPDTRTFAPNPLAWPRWAFDTGYSGDMFCSPTFLHTHYAVVAVDPTPDDPAAAAERRLLEQTQAPRLTVNGFSRLQSSAIGQERRVWCYRATVWLGSNVGLPPIPIYLPRGVYVRTGRRRPLLGIRPLLGTGIRIIVHYDVTSPSVSVTVPSDLVSRGRG